jgi:hypothetical protein
MLSHWGNIEGDNLLMSVPGGKEYGDLLFYMVESGPGDCL